MRNLSDAFELLIVAGRRKAAIKHAKSTDETEEDMSTSEAKSSPGNSEDSFRGRAVSSAGAVPSGLPPEVVDLNDLRVASVPLPGFVLHESLPGVEGTSRRVRV